MFFLTVLRIRPSSGNITRAHGLEADSFVAENNKDPGENLLGGAFDASFSRTVASSLNSSCPFVPRSPPGANGRDGIDATSGSGGQASPGAER